MCVLDLALAFGVCGLSIYQPKSYRNKIGPVTKCSFSITSIFRCTLPSVVAQTLALNTYNIFFLMCLVSVRW